MIWKNVNGYDGLYLVSNTGLVKTIERNYVTGKNGRIKINSPECLMKQYEADGYSFVRLCKDGKTSLKRVHRLVANAFIENTNNLQFINHINGIRHDNRLNNLEWCSQKENVIHAYATGLNKGRNGRSVAMIDANNVTVKEYIKISDAVLDGFRHDCIVTCCRGKHKEHKGYKWKYIN